MTQQYQESIISFLGDREGEPIRVADLAETLNIPPDDRRTFEQAVEDLVANGRAVWGGGGRQAPAAPSNSPLSATASPAPSARPCAASASLSRRAQRPRRPLHPPGDNLDAVTGDFVVAKVIVSDKYDAGNKRNTRGRIIEILKRAASKLVGTLVKQNGRWVVVPDGHIFKTVVEIQDIGAKNAAENDKVVVELLRFPSGDLLAQGVITEILGAKGEPQVELQSVIRQFDLPSVFPEPVLAQARTAATTYDPLYGPAYSPRLAGVTPQLPQQVPPQKRPNPQLSPPAKTSATTSSSPSTPTTPKTSTTPSPSKN